MKKVDKNLDSLIEGRKKLEILFPEYLERHKELARMFKELED